MNIFPLVEQEWVVRLGIRHEASVLQCPHANGTRFLPPGQSKPAPVDHLELIPATVMEKMLVKIERKASFNRIFLNLCLNLDQNGDVSGKFQSELIKWLKKDLRFSDADFHKFQLQSPEFCSDDGCMSISNIGGICCPFG